MLNWLLLLLLMCRKMYSRDPLIDAGNRQLALVLERILNQLCVGERRLFGAVMKDRNLSLNESVWIKNIENKNIFFLYKFKLKFKVQVAIRNIFLKSNDCATYVWLEYGGGALLMTIFSATFRSSSMHGSFADRWWPASSYCDCCDGL